MKNEEAELYSIFSKMKKMRFMGKLLGTSILLSVCTAKSDVHQKKEESNAVEVKAVAATPESLNCQVELHDSDLKMFRDGSVQLEVLADGFEIAEGPLWIPSMKILLFSDVKGNKIHQWSEAKGSNVFLSPGGQGIFLKRFPEICAPPKPLPPLTITHSPHPLTTPTHHHTTLTITTLTATATHHTNSPPHSHPLTRV